MSASRIFSGLVQTSSISRCSRKLRLSIVSISSGSLTATIKPALTEADRNDFEAARIFAADLFDDIRRDGHGREIDPIHVRLRGEAAGNIGFGNDAVLDQNIDDVGGAVERGARFFDLRARHQPDVLEDIEDVIFVWMHHRKLSRPRGNRKPLLDRDALREIARFIDVAPELDGEMIGEQLQRNRGQESA